MRIYLDSVGCRLNQSEIELLGRDFRARGHEIVAAAGEADLAVINTCAVTVQAGAESRKLIRRTARAGAGEVVATGCWATFDPAGAAALSGVTRVVTNPEKDGLVPLVLDLPAETFDLEPVAREPLPGARLRTRAYIKLQDGCDNRCTFCITTVVRGAGRSRALGDVLADIRAAVDGGTREVVLTGVHLGSWGQDLDGSLRIRDLVAAVLGHTDAARVRLSSLEPWDLDAGFFSLWADEPRLCRHLHLPLQSGCDRTLRRMARKTSQKSFRKLLREARAACPEMAITTDLIAGFPGETEDEFSETAAFVEEMEFAGAHVFPYSERPGTAAASMPGQVDHPVRKQRAAALRRIVRQSERRYRERFAGRTLPVLWESAAGLGPDGWHMTGLTDNYLRVSAVASRDLWNELTPVVLEEVTEEGLRAQIVKE
jgi:threonylcarbamoyladenosine tRNA methylthiotransferase MtaB